MIYVSNSNIIKHVFQGRLIDRSVSLPQGPFEFSFPFTIIYSLDLGCYWFILINWKKVTIGMQFSVINVPIFSWWLIMSDTIRIIRISACIMFFFKVHLDVRQLRYFFITNSTLISFTCFKMNIWCQI